MATKTSPELELNLALYRKLYLIRKSEQKIIEYYPENEMKTPMHMSMGQEAIAVGVCAALGDRGQIFSSYRSHAAFLARTGNVEMFFMEMYGRGGTLTGGKAGSMHLASPSEGVLCSSAIVGSAIPLAAGAAFANRYKKNDLLACVFFGDGALEEGIFWETLNAASAMKLPVLLVCEDNGFAVHTSKQARHGFRSITEIVRHYQCHVFQEDTTDAEKIYQLTRQAVTAMQRDPRPVFLHLQCYRYLEHVGINEDFDANYRPREDYENWLKRDAVALGRKKLLESGLAEADISREERKLDEEIDRCVQKAKNAPFPQKQELYHGVFHETN